MVGCGGFDPATAGAAIMARAAANEPAIPAGEMALLEFIGDPFQKRRRDLRNRYLSRAFRTSEESGNVQTYSKSGGLLHVSRCVERQRHNCVMGFVG